MTALGRKAIVVTWYEVISLRVYLDTGQHKRVEQNSLGIKETASLAHRLGKDAGLRYITEPDAFPGSIEDWLIRYIEVKKEEYYILCEVDVVLEYGNKTTGRIVTDNWVRTRNLPTRRRSKPTTNRVDSHGSHADT